MKNTAKTSVKVQDLKEKTWKEKAAQEIKDAFTNIKKGIYAF
jgi:hypothetical protein